MSMLSQVMEERMRLLDFDVLNKSLLDDLLGKVPISNLGVILAAKRLAQLLIDAEENSDEAQ